MEEEKIIEFLKISGLNLYESKIYFALLKYGTLGRSDIYKLSGIPQNRVYDVIRSLFTKSLIKQEGNEIIIPQHPRNIMNSFRYLKNKEKIINIKKKIENQLELFTKKERLISDAKNIFNWLEKMYNSPLTQYPVINRLLSIFKESKREILCCTTLPVSHPSRQFYEEALRAVRRGVSYKRVLGYDYVLAQGEKSITMDEKKRIKIKVTPDKNIKGKYYISDDKIVFLRAIKSTPDLEIEEAYIFDQKEIISSYKNSFEKLWKDGEVLEFFLKRVRSKISSNKWSSSILMDVLENGRTNREALLKKFKSQKSKIQELIKNGILKNSEVKDMLIIDVPTLFKT